MLNKHADVSKMLPLVNTILFGNPTPILPTPLSLPEGVPSIGEMHTLNLDEAKLLAINLDNAIAPLSNTNVVGEAIIIDTLSYVASAQVARRCANVGLTVATHFTTTQPNQFQCGHNCAGWVCLLRALGNHHRHT